MMSEPTRLLDDPAIADGLRADLAQANSVVLEGLDLSAGAAGLKAAIAVETSAVGTAGAGAGKMLALGLLGTVTAGALVWLALRSPEPDPHPRLGAADPVAAAPEAAGVAAPSEPVSDLSEPDVVDAEAAPSVVEPEPKPEPDAVPSQAEPEAPARDVAAAARKRPRKANKQDDYLREAKLISDARAAMKTDASAALKLLEEARSEFPRGMLREERKALTILSLDRLGRSAQAQASAKRFLKQHGEGPYAAAVRQVLD